MSEKYNDGDASGSGAAGLLRRKFGLEPLPDPKNPGSKTRDVAQPFVPESLERLSEFPVSVGDVFASNEHPSDPQDCYRIGKGIAMVFDGVGSVVKSAEAAECAADAIGGYLEAARATLNSGAAKESVKNMLVDAFNTASDNIIEKNLGMTTAVCAVMFIEEVTGKRMMAIAHTGDSRAYLLKGKEVECLTVDNSGQRNQNFNIAAIDGVFNRVKADAFLKGKQRDGANDLQTPRNSMLSSKLGGVDNPKVDVVILEIEPGDVFLFTSDGVHDAMTQDDMPGSEDPSIQSCMQLAKTKGPEEGVRKILKFAMDGQIKQEHPDDGTAVFLVVPETRL